MPDDHRELPGRCDGGDMLTAACTDSKEEGAQWPWRSRSSPGGLDEHAARMPTALLGDPPVVGRPRARLSDARVEAEIADELLGLVETTRLADRRHDGKRHHHVDARDRHQLLDPVVRQSRASKIALDDFKVFAEPIELAQV